MNIPFETVSGIILMKAAVNSTDGFMAFDTGAMQTCLNRVYFPSLAGKSVEVAKFDQDIQTASAAEAVCDLRCHRWSVSGASVLLLDMNYVEAPLRQLKPELRFLGTIGIDLIREHTVLLDYAREQLCLDESAPKGLTAFSMKTEALPLIDVNIAERAYPFVLDTGANTCLLDPSLGTERFSIIDEANGIVRIPKLAALGSEYHDIVAVMRPMDEIQRKVKAFGVIGYQVLKDCLSFFDFKNRQIGIQADSAR